MKYRKIMACLLASFILLSTALCPLAEEPSSGGQTTTSGPEEAVFAQPFDVSAESVYMVNLDTGLVMYSKNPQKRWPPASLTKMMTAYVALRQVQAGRATMNSGLTVSQRAARSAPSPSSPSAAINLSRTSRERSGRPASRQAPAASSAMPFSSM